MFRSLLISGGFIPISNLYSTVIMALSLNRSFLGASGFRRLALVADSYACMALMAFNNELMTHLQNSPAFDPTDGNVV